MYIADILVQIADKALENPNEFIRAGHNGPYHDPETPVRNRAHWLITFANVFEWTGQIKYCDTVRDLVAYICSEEARPHGYSFHHRNKTGKDKCNGLIGQAWTFEALAKAAACLGHEKYSELAEQVFFQHPFNSDFGLWNRLEIDGEIFRFDATFNHQLWFAACASLHKGQQRSTIIQRINRFMDCLSRNLAVMDNGLIYHPIDHLIDGQQGKEYNLEANIKRFIKNANTIFRKVFFSDSYLTGEQQEKKKHKKMVYKSIGYHAFNTYAFGILKEQIPEHPFWQSDSFKKCIDFLESEEYINGLNDNKFGFPYNPPGFEVPFSKYVLLDGEKGQNVEDARYWISKQFEYCFDKNTYMMSRNNEDPVTHTARIYEITRLPLDFLEKIEMNI
jgi:hypothetical protein